jgi:hypothetical protein
MTGWTFHPKLVDPFYLHFMNGNIVADPFAGQRDAVIALFKQRLPEYTDEGLRAMLAESWRPAKVAAWVIGAERRRRYLPEIARRVLEQPAYAEHFCICLGRLGGEQALAALMSYLDGCASGALQFNPYDETVSPDWALCALEYLDAGRAAAGESRWAVFLERQVPLLRKSYERRRQANRDIYRKVMALLDEHWGAAG